MTSASGGGVAVWCYRVRNLWNAFEPTVSNYIENAHVSISNGQSSNNTVNIDHLSSRYVASEIDLRRQVFRIAGEGEEYAVERKVCPSGSLYSNNSVWEFEGDPVDTWITYDLETSQIIEDAHPPKGKRIKKGHVLLDLSYAMGIPYTIDLRKNTQTNMNTSKVRKIRRRDLTVSYTSTVCDATTAFVPNTKKRKKAVCSRNCTGDVKDAKTNVRDSSCSIALPKKKQVVIGAFNGSSSDNVAEFLSKFTKHIIPDSKDDGKADHDDNKGDDIDDEVEECSICFDKLSDASGYGEDQPDAKDVVELLKCHHTFHKLCLVKMYKTCDKDGFLECPYCKCVHGEKVGNCPAGKMKWMLREDLVLPGHEDCAGAIIVNYDIQTGMQAQGHPNPGQPYRTSGFPRIGYIPNSDKGRMVLKLLMEAFQRRLMFTVGTSVTTGRSDTVIWNDIHHKTEAQSNYSGHGYPDPNYLDNVLSELNAQGISEKCLGN